MQEEKQKLDKRPEEYVHEITLKLHSDIFHLISQQMLNVAQNMVMPDSNKIEAEVAKLTVSVALGLKTLVKYTELYTLKKHNEDN